MVWIFQRAPSLRKCFSDTSHPSKINSHNQFMWSYFRCGHIHFQVLAKLVVWKPQRCKCSSVPVFWDNCQIQDELLHGIYHYVVEAWNTNDCATIYKVPFCTWQLGNDYLRRAHTFIWRIFIFQNSRIYIVQNLIFEIQVFASCAKIFASRLNSLYGMKRRLESFYFFHVGIRNAESKGSYGLGKSIWNMYLVQWEITKYTRNCTFVNDIFRHLKYRHLLEIKFSG